MEEITILESRLAKAEAKLRACHTMNRSLDEGCRKADKEILGLEAENDRLKVERDGFKKEIDQNSVVIARQLIEIVQLKTERAEWAKNADKYYVWFRKCVNLWKRVAKRLFHYMNLCDLRWEQMDGLDPETGKAWLTPKMMVDSIHLGESWKDQEIARLRQALMEIMRCDNITKAWEIVAKARGIYHAYLCPKCGKFWNQNIHNACECGAWITSRKEGQE